MLELLQDLEKTSTARQSFRVVVDYKKPIGEVIRSVCKKSTNFVEYYKDNARNMPNGESVNVEISPVIIEGCKDLKEAVSGMITGGLSPLTVHEAVALYTQHKKAFLSDPDVRSFDSLLILCGDTKVNSPLLIGMGRESVVGVEIVMPRNSSFMSDVEVLVDYVALDMRLRPQWRLYSVREVSK